MQRDNSVLKGNLGIPKVRVPSGTLELEIFSDGTSVIAMSYLLSSKSGRLMWHHVTKLRRLTASLSLWAYNNTIRAMQHVARVIRYDTIRDAILTCARKPTWVSLIYRTEPTTKKCKNRRTKSRKQICSEITVNSTGNPCSEYLRRRNEGLQWEVFAEKEGFKPGVKE